MDRGVRPHPATVRDWLTGWTSGSEQLANAVLSFPTRESAERYCKRIGIAYQVRDLPAARHRPPIRQRFEADLVPLCCWLTGPHALCCGRYPCLEPPSDAKTKSAGWQAGAPAPSSGVPPQYLRTAGMVTTPKAVAPGPSSGDRAHDQRGNARPASCLSIQRRSNVRAVNRP
ncbi:NADH dehydrogenase ubiquinone Fe-S protein 4 [Sphingobium naphthae]|uniref:NADH dehydrogenase ubiquinone Fe-S protein 4 n=1 Tax=Sphingobium naphthae TaxID=1886786 RepID=UPI0037483B8D